MGNVNASERGGATGEREESAEKKNETGKKLFYCAVLEQLFPCLERKAPARRTNESGADMRWEYERGGRTSVIMISMSAAFKAVLQLFFRFFFGRVMSAMILYGGSYDRRLQRWKTNFETQTQQKVMRCERERVRVWGRTERNKWDENIMWWAYFFSALWWLFFGLLKDWQSEAASFSDRSDLFKILAEWA